MQVCLRAFGFDVKKKDMIELRREFDQRQTGKIDFVDFSEIFKILEINSDKKKFAKV